MKVADESGQPDGLSLLIDKGLPGQKLGTVHEEKPELGGWIRLSSDPDQRVLQQAKGSAHSQDGSLPQFFRSNSFPIFCFSLPIIND